MGLEARVKKERTRIERAHWIEHDDVETSVGKKERIDDQRKPLAAQFPRMIPDCLSGGAESNDVGDRVG